MSIQPKTISKELLEKFTSFSKDKVLSELELSRFLVQAKSVANINAAEAWHVRGIAYYFANHVDEMKYAFTNALKLSPQDILILNNAAACSMNHAQLEYALELFFTNSNFFLGTSKDYDFVLKLSKLALNFYDFYVLDKIIATLKDYTLSDKKINSLIKSISDEYEVVANNLQEIGVDWKDAKKISQIAFSTIQKNKLRPSSFVETNIIDDEIFSTIHVHGSLSNIMKINDLLFNEIYELGYLNIWNKLMITYAIAAPEDVKDVA